GGEIVVSVAALDAQTAQLAVRDHGVGIPPADRPYIFERYYRGYRDRRFGGLGLGLALCRQIVEGHGGHISVECPPDGGTRFVLTLPRVLPPAG
ncbi:MAG: sensor histidine kinase, partial [Chloroflexi bacterium]|nr:sensor histidine kinase [Chloroflexota bacterium]